MSKITLKLGQWDPVKIGLTSHLGIFGPGRMGKTFLIRDLLYKNHHRFSDVVVICPAPHAAEKYRKLSPHILVFCKLDGETLEAINDLYARQKILTARGDGRKLLIILDSCISADKRYLNSPIIKQLYKDRDTFALWVIVQYLNDLAPDCRNQLDIFIVLKTGTLTMQHKLYQFLNGGDFKDEKQFCATLQKYTTNFGCLVKDTTAAAENFFWYKADLVPETLDAQQAAMIFNQCPLLQGIAERYQSLMVGQDPDDDDNQDPDDDDHNLTKLQFLGQPYNPYDPRWCKQFLSFEVRQKLFVPSSLEHHLLQTRKLLESSGSKEMMKTFWQFVKNISGITSTTSTTSSVESKQIYSAALFRSEVLKDYLFELGIPAVVCGIILSYDLDYVLSESIVIDRLRLK